MTIDAGTVARRYELVDGRPRTVALVAGGVDVAVDGDEVAVTVDGRRWSDPDLEASGVTEGPGHGSLSWFLRTPGGEVCVRLAVVADPAAGVVRKRVEVMGRGRLEHVELDRWPALAATGPATTGEPVPYNAGAVGLGQPVFGPGVFAGVEHPLAENLAGRAGDGTGVTLGIPVAADLGPQPFRAPTAVVGAGGLEEFWDYLDTIRPVPPRLVTLTNNWYHLGAPGTMDEAAVVAEVAGFAAVAERHGLALDFACLDDGWEGDWHPATGLWGRMAPARFPAGIAPLGDRIGLWLSAFGGYGERRQARLAWAAGHGLEVDEANGLLCPAGARYRAQLLDALTGWTRAGVGYWKLDGVRFDCDDPGHGHLTGPGSRTAKADAFLRLVAAVRAERPGAVVAFTIGSHPSPWWLGAVDFLWRGGLDDTTAEHPGTRLDRFDTYIDTCLQAYRPAALPVSALVAFSVVESDAAGYRDAASGPEGWARHCWLAVGRGTLHHDLYVAPGSLTDAEWAVLAEALAWARRHQEVLARSRMVLGDPAAGEVYGFAARHPRGAAAVACLRNPADRPQAVEVDWAALLGTGTPPTVRYGRPLPAAGPLTLGPFEVVVCEATTRPQ